MASCYSSKCRYILWVIFIWLWWHFSIVFNKLYFLLLFYVFVFFSCILKALFIYQCIFIYLITAFCSYFISYFVIVFRRTYIYVYLLAAKLIICFDFRFEQIVCMNTMVDIFSFLQLFHNIFVFIESVSIVYIIGNWNRSNCLVCIKIRYIFWLCFHLIV